MPRSSGGSPGPGSTQHLDHPLLSPLAERDLIRPLSARSLIASTLLGTHPPRLPGALLVAFGAEFGMAAGTVRVALSRMSERAEVVNEDGVYELTGDLVDRQSRQDRGRHRLDEEWDGTWLQALVVGTGREATDRARLRTTLGRRGFAERREGVWLRPASKLPPALGPADSPLEWYRTSPLDPARSAALAAELFPLDRWAEEARVLVAALEATTEAMGDGLDRDTRGSATTDPTAEGRAEDDARSRSLPLPVPFLVAAATLRHLANDPLLPSALLPEDWPGGDLRTAYDALDLRHRAQLRAFFSSVRRNDI